MVRTRHARYSERVSDPATQNEGLWYVHRLDLASRVPSSVLESLRSDGILERWGHRADVPLRERDLITVILRGGVDIGAGGLSVRLKAGDVLGALTDDPTLRVRAYDDTLMCHLPRVDFDSLVGASLGSLTTRVGLRPRVELSVPIEDLLYRSSYEQVASALLYLAEFEGHRGRLDVRLKPRHLADLTGTEASHSRRLFDEFLSQKLVESSRRELILPDLSMIRSIAESRLS